MKMRNKGKVHPSSPATSSAGDTLSVLNLLPAAILTLTIVLSLEDREVLAYMLTRSIKSTNVVTKKKTLNNNNNNNNHKSPVFDCECFECYTTFWEKWDCSPNRELIHQAIEAFEETLTNGEMFKKKNKKRVKMGHRRLAGKGCENSPEDDVAAVFGDVEVVGVKDEENGDDPDDGNQGGDTVVVVEELPEMMTATAVVVGGGSQHKGLTRKVLPDVIGLLNWRLWSLWSPN